MKVLGLRIVPLTIKAANAMVRQLHRHHKPVVGALFAVGCQNAESKLVGCAIVGRPVARGLQNGFTAEVVRVATDGTRNVCSKLYAASRRAAHAMGYTRVITYTLPEESGASLRAAGWELYGAAGGGSWSCPSRPRIDKAPTQRKLRWETQP